MIGEMVGKLGDQILQTLQRRKPPAAFVTEVAATLRPTPPRAEIEETIANLDEAGRMLVVPHAAPDVHLESTDLRVLASVPNADENAARDAAEQFWSIWLRTFLANHHCE